MDAAAALTQLLQDDHFVWYRNKPWDKISKRHLQLFEKLVEQAPAYTLDYTNRDIPKIPGRLKTLLRKQV